MADTKISDLNTLTSENAESTDSLVLVDGSATETKRITVSEAKELFNAEPINVTHSPYNADKTGVSDATSAWQSAIADAQGGPVVIPAGTYILDDCQISTRYGCHLIPQGDVVISYDGSSTEAPLYYDVNAGATETIVSATTVATEDDFPA